MIKPRGCLLLQIIMIFFINTALKCHAAQESFLTELCKVTYNYFLAVDHFNNGLLHDFYYTSDGIDGLIFSIGVYDLQNSHFDKSNSNYTFNVDSDYHYEFPQNMVDPCGGAGGGDLEIQFKLISNDIAKELTLFLNSNDWGGPVGGSDDFVQLYINGTPYGGAFKLGSSSYMEKRFDFPANTFNEGANTIRIEITCSCSCGWFSWDSIQFGETVNSGMWHAIGVGDYFECKVSPEEIGFFLLSHLGAWEMDIIDIKTAKTRIESGLFSLKNLEKKDGLFYRYYQTLQNGVVDYEIPSIGNAMLVLSLLTLEQWAIENNFNDIQNDVSTIVQEMSLLGFWNASTHKFYLTDQRISYWDHYSDEGRLISFCAYAMGNLSRHEFKQNLSVLDKPTLYYDRSSGKTTDSRTASDDIKVKNTSWDGSIFTYLAPSLFINEVETYYYNGTINPAVFAQINYAAAQFYQIDGEIVWGISDCFDSTLEYCWEFRGAPPSNANYLYDNNYECQLDSSNNCKTSSCPAGIITPYASALALLSRYSNEAIDNLMNLKNHSTLYHNLYGFKDAVNLTTNEIANIILTLDQQWIFLSLMNFKNKSIWKYLYKNSSIKNAHNIMYPIAIAPINSILLN